MELASESNCAAGRASGEHLITATVGLGGIESAFAAKGYPVSMQKHPLSPNSRPRAWEMRAKGPDHRPSARTSVFREDLDSRVLALDGMIFGNQLKMDVGVLARAVTKADDRLGVFASILAVMPRKVPFRAVSWARGWDNRLHVRCLCQRANRSYVVYQWQCSVGRLG